MKSDTAIKKPKLYNLLIFSVFAAAVITALMLTDFTGRAGAAALVADFYFLGALFLLIRALRGQMRYNPYSYNTIFYIGFSVFAVFLLFTNIILTVRFFRQPEVYTDMFNLTGTLAQASSSYLLLTFPLALIFSLFLFISNISLVRHEGRRFANVLGIILSFMTVGGTLLLYRLDYYVSGSEFQVMMHDIAVNIYSSVLLYFECMLIGAVAASVIAARYKPDYDKDIIIVLGCGIRKDGTPTPLLRGRLDRAIEFYRAQKENTGKDMIFAVSGGQGPDEVIPESECMKNYLVSQGIDESLIVEENKSTSTLENMKFSKEIIDGINPRANVIYSTTNYHVFRSGLCARRVKMKAVGIGSKTKWYFWPNAWVREFAGLVAAHRGKQALICAGLILFFVILTLVHYR